MLPFAHRPPRSLLEHHDPHAGLHPQFRRRGFEPLAPFAGTLRVEQHRPAWQPVEHHPVDPVGPPVRGAEDDVASRVARPPHRPVQERQGSGRRPAVPQIVQRGLEQGIRLAVHALEHHPVQQPLVHDRADGLGLEEPGPLPLAAGPEHPGLGAAHVYDGRQLGEVAGEDHLHAAEREPRFAGAFEEPVEAVHEVGAHEPVHGDALHVQGGYPRGGEREDVPIGVEAPPVPDERAFPGARLASEEHGAARVVQRPERVRVVMVSAFIHAGAYASDGPGGTRYASPGPGMRAVCIR